MQQRNAGRNMRDPAAPASMLAGLLAGMGTAFCGTMHYVVYGLIKPLTDEGFLYWFPDATRYIGYDPDLPDKTIHEFPAYSSILGDLHAHYLNILFVVTVTAVISDERMYQVAGRSTGQAQDFCYNSRQTLTGAGAINRLWKGNNSTKIQLHCKKLNFDL